MTLSDADARLRAEAEVRAYCGWHVAPSRRESITLDGDDSGVLLLPTLRMTALHSLSVRGASVNVDDELVVEWSTSGVVRCSTRTASMRGVVVELTHGFDDWPLEVLSVIDRLTQRALDDPGALVQVGAVRYATSSDGLPIVGLTELDKLVIDRYRLPSRV